MSTNFISSLPDSDGIILDETARFTIVSPSWRDDPTQWKEVTHCGEPRRSIILRAGDELSFKDEFKIEKGYVAHIRYAAGLPDISADGLVFEIIIR